MAKQAGPLPFTGSIGGVTGYKRNGKYCLKEKSGPSREQVLTSPRFKRTLENAKEFRRTTKAGKLVRGCLKNLTKGMKLADNEISGRLNSLLSKIVKSDPVHDRGERTVSKGQLEWLEDFAFRKETSFSSICTVCPASTMDTDTGLMKVEICAFDPQQRINAPESATHFKVVVNGAAIDFEKERVDWNYKETSFMSLSEYVEEPILLEQTLKPRPGQALLQAIGIAFYRQGEDGHFERVPGGVMRILQVSEPGLEEIKRIEVSEPALQQVGTSLEGSELPPLNGTDGSAIHHIFRSAEISSPWGDKEPNQLGNIPGISGPPHGYTTKGIHHSLGGSFDTDLGTFGNALHHADG
jgi:hypothetical protein